jgi:hypothetical protein
MKSKAQMTNGNEEERSDGTPEYWVRDLSFQILDFTLNPI